MGLIFKYINRIKIILFFCLLVSLLFFSNNLYDKYQLAKAGSLLFFLVFLFLITIFEKQKIKIDFVFIFFFIYILYIIFILFKSKFYSPSFYIAIFLLSFVFLAPLFLDFDLKKFLIFIALIFFVSTIYGIYQYFTGKARPYSFYGNPIFFAEFLGVLFPFLFISFYFIKKNSFFLLLNIILGIISLILCASRGPLIAFFVSFVFFLLIFFKYRLIKFSDNFKIHLTAAIVLLFFIFLIPGFFNALKFNLQRTFDLLTVQNSSIKTRILTSKAALLLAKENLISGNGAGSYRYYFPKYQADILKNEKGFYFINTSYVHNDFLQYLSEFGILGLFLFLVFVFGLIYYYEKLSPFLEDDEFIFSTACVTSLLFILCEAFFNFPLFILPSAFLFFLIAGLLYINLKKYINFYFFTLNSKIISFLVLIIIFSVSFVKPFDYLSNFYLNYGIKLTIKYLPKDRDYISKAISLSPKNFNNYFFMGNAFASIKKYDEAIEYYKKCLDIYPYSSDILYDIGNIYRAKKENEKAIEYYKKAIDLYPDFAEPHYNLGKLYSLLNQQELADKEFALVSRLNPLLFENEFSNRVLFFSEATFDYIKIFDNNEKSKGKN